MWGWWETSSSVSCSIWMWVCVSYKGRVLVEAGLGELFEALGEISAQRRRRALGDVEQHSHRMHVGVRGFALGELDGRDAQRPNIHLQRQTRTVGISRSLHFNPETAKRCLWRSNLNFTYNVKTDRMAPDPSRSLVYNQVKNKLQSVRDLLKRHFGRNTATCFQPKVKKSSCCHTVDCLIFQKTQRDNFKLYVTNSPKQKDIQFTIMWNRERQEATERSAPSIINTVDWFVLLIKLF